MIKVSTEQMIRVFYFKAIDDPTAEYWGPFDLMHQHLMHHLVYLSSHRRLKRFL